MCVSSANQNTESFRKHLIARRKGQKLTSHDLESNAKVTNAQR
jgi:hypothetical protein